MEIVLGECKMLGKHKDCECGGKVIRYSPQTINGRVYPNTELMEEHLWCNGRKWMKKGGVSVWEFCNCSSRRGDVLEVEE